MIQFNLLPDVKLAYIRATRRKRVVVVTATSVMAVSVTVLVLLFLVVNVVQKRHLSALSVDINASAKELQDTPDLDKILTVQNQLMKLGELHDKKPVTTRLFKYLAEVTPTDVSIAKLDVDFSLKTMKFTGASTSLNTINTFVDTLKFTTFTVTEKNEETGETRQSSPKPAFSNVVLTSFGRTNDQAAYSIDLVFDEAIFDSAQDAQLVVPDTISTRSETEKPLFDGREREEQDE